MNMKRQFKFKNDDDDEHERDNEMSGLRMS